MPQSLVDSHTDTEERDPFNYITNSQFHWWPPLQDPQKERNGKPLTLACSIAACAAFSASRCRLSFSFNEKMATDLARFTRLCFNLDFLAAASAAFTAAAASSSEPMESLPTSTDPLCFSWLLLECPVAAAVTPAVDEDDATGLSAVDLELDAVLLCCGWL